ncbi:hypothetical protein [Photobacterium leiognathi]|uniref:hypothetical protein n=1 Tax=Photobacterium leiognathi TaxID=553611 RepID=UPI002980D00C|nr:hypothetical protein [Photobacterium leiognathi]
MDIQQRNKRFYVNMYGAYWWSFSKEQWLSFVKAIVTNGVDAYNENGFILPESRSLSARPSTIRVERTDYNKFFYTNESHIRIIEPLDWEFADWQAENELITT